MPFIELPSIMPSSGIAYFGEYHGSGPMTVVNDRIETVTAEMNVKYALRLLARFGINRALVTRDGELVGLVTLRDMVVGYAGSTEPRD